MFKKSIAFIKKFKRFTHEKIPEIYGINNLDEDLTGFMPHLKGLPVVRDDVLYERMKDDIKIIKSELGLTEDQFQLYIEPIFVNFSKLVHLLPASEFHHHSTGGGLIHHSFDVACRATRHATMTQYPAVNGRTYETQQCIPEWKSATVIAALLHDCGKAITDMIITNGAKDENEIVWNPDGKESITEWCGTHKLERYFVRWTRNKSGKHKTASLTLIDRLIPRRTMEWLGACLDGKAIRSIMSDGISSANYDHVLCKIVATCDAESLKWDMRTRNSHISTEVKQTPISIILTDLMRYYIMSDKWPINKKNSKIWFVDNELYLVWSMIAPELIEEMADAGYKAHDAPDVLARKLVEGGLAEDNGDELYFKIYPEILRDASNPKALVVLKFTAIQKLILEPAKLFSIEQHPLKTDKKAIVEQKQEQPKDQYFTEEEKHEPIEEKESVDHYLESGKNTFIRLLDKYKQKLSGTKTADTQPEQTENYHSDPMIDNYELPPLDSYDEYDNEPQETSYPLEDMALPEEDTLSSEESPSKSGKDMSNDELKFYISEQFDLPLSNNNVLTIPFNSQTKIIEHICEIKGISEIECAVIINQIQSKN